ncbi:hypothetical protein Trydic_g8677 [Trypoxylus dichotomus]
MASINKVGYVARLPSLTDFVTDCLASRAVCRLTACLPTSTDRTVRDFAGTRAGHLPELRRANHLFGHLVGSNVNHRMVVAFDRDPNRSRRRDRIILRGLPESVDVRADHDYNAFVIRFVRLLFFPSRRRRIRTLLFPSVLFVCRYPASGCQVIVSLLLEGVGEEK